MTWSKAIYPPLHDLLFVHQLSGEQIKSLVGELELKKVVGQDPQARENNGFLKYQVIFELQDVGETS